MFFRRSATQKRARRVSLCSLSFSPVEAEPVRPPCSMCARTTTPPSSSGCPLQHVQGPVRRLRRGGGVLARRRQGQRALLRSTGTAQQSLPSTDGVVRTTCGLIRNSLTSLYCLRGCPANICFDTITRKTALSDFCFMMEECELSAFFWRGSAHAPRLLFVHPPNIPASHLFLRFAHIRRSRL